MNTFSFLWRLLVVILTISNMYRVLKYVLDRFLLKNNQKIGLPLLQALVLLICVFFDILNDFLKNYGSYELIKILNLSRIEPFIFNAFLASSILIFLIFLVTSESNFISKRLNFLIFCSLMGLLFSDIVTGIGNILFGENPPFFSFFPFWRKVFFIYRKITFPSIYLVSFILFWFMSKRKIYDENDHNNKIKAVNMLKNFAVYLYLFYVFGMIYFYFYDPLLLLTDILFTSFAFILLYIGISYYTSNKDNKGELFGNLYKKTYFLGMFLPVLIVLAFMGYYGLKELKINIIIIIITAVLTAVITCIINIYINRYFNSK